ncbi:MAG: hypothetical protein ACRD4U_01660 [Candidatus Acidiferrales bacterium]
MRLSRLLAAVFLSLLVASLAPGDNLDKHRQELARANNPIDRAKATAKLGDELIKQVSDRYREGAYTDGEQLLDEYLKAVRAAYRGLQDSGRDARRKPAGFKQLEIHLRKSAHTLERIAQHTSTDAREPLVEAQTEVESIRSELLQALMHGNAKPKSNI